MTGPSHSTLLLLVTSLLQSSCVKSHLENSSYKPTWESLDSRPLPEWFDEAKIGIFVHWGVFSVPALTGSTSAEWFWTDWENSKPGEFLYDFMKMNYPATWTYGDFANQFTAELFDANKWIELFQDAVAK